MRKKPDLVLALVVFVAAGVILSNLVIAMSPQSNNNKSVLDMQQAFLQSISSPKSH
jgi:Na+-transporting NADH:ubiquinone oxidoreductase subunit NqrC